MGLETGNYINDLNTANPAATDPKSQGDDHLRLLKAVLKNTLPGFTGVILGAGTEAQGSTVNDFTVTLSPAPAAYTANTIVAFKATHANTSACTLQIGALGTKNFLAVDGGPLSSGDITTGEFVIAIYDGTSFYLLSGNDRASRDGDTYTGTHNFTGAVTTFASATVDLTGNGVTVSTQTAGDSSAKPASTAFTTNAIATASIVAATNVTPDPLLQFGII